MRLEPSTPTFPRGAETWPEGTPNYIKEMFEQHQKLCSQSDSTVDDIDAWYFNVVNRLQLKANRTKKKRESRRLPRNLASASLEHQAKLIQFHTTSMSTCSLSTTGTTVDTASPPVAGATQLWRELRAPSYHALPPCRPGSSLWVSYFQVVLCHCIASKRMC